MNIAVRFERLLYNIKRDRFIKSFFFLISRRRRDNNNSTPRYHHKHYADRAACLSPRLCPRMTAGLDLQTRFSISSSFCWCWRYKANHLRLQSTAGQQMVRLRATRHVTPFCTPAWGWDLQRPISVTIQQTG